MLVIATRDLFERYPLVIRDTSRTRKLTEDFGKLRWINLQGFTSEYLPNDFNLHDAMAIDLKHSLLLLVWKEHQVFISCHFLLKLSLIKIKILFVYTYNYIGFSFSSLIFCQKLSA